MITVTYQTYTDLGFSRGMHLGINRAKEIGQAIEYRQLSPTLLDRL